MAIMWPNYFCLPQDDDGIFKPGRKRHAIVMLIFDIQHWDIGDTFATHSLQTVVGKVVVK